MEALGIIGFFFGLYAFIRVEKLEKKLKVNGILDKKFNSE